MTTLSTAPLFQPHFDKFWEHYPRHVAKGRAIKNWNTLVKSLSEDEAKDTVEKMILAIHAQHRERNERKKANEWVADWPHPGSWITDRRWLDELESHAAIKQRVNQQKHECNCGATDAFAFSGGYICNACYLKTTDLTDLREAYKRHGLQRKKDETPEDHKTRMVNLCRQLASRIGKTA